MASFREKMQRMHYIDRRLRHRRDYPTAPELARDYAAEAGEEVTERTIKRDIREMREDYLAPIGYDPQRRGYFYTREDFQLPGIHLSEGDLLALLVADRALVAYRNTPFHEKLRKVVERLARQLPDKVTVESQELATGFSVVPDPVTEIKSGVWDTLQQCLAEQVTAALRYQAPGYDEPAVRLVDPYHLVGYRGEWYLLGWSRHDEEVRVYALARIVKCTKWRTSFTRAPDFKVGDYIDPNFGIFLNEPWVDVAVRFDAAVASRIRERVWHLEQRIEDLDDGDIILRYRTNQQSQTLFWAGQWGPNAEILEPVELRDRAREWFRDAAAQYRE